MQKEKRDDGAGDPIKSLLEESLDRQRNEMMDSFSQILRQIPTTASTSSMSTPFRDATPFKVQVIYDIPLFEGKIDADALYNSLIVLEAYFFVHNFFDRQKITFALLKVVPHVQNWWGTYWEQNSSNESGIFETSSRNNTTLWETMMASTQNGPF